MSMERIKEYTTYSLTKESFNTKMAAVQQNFSKMISAQLRIKSNEFLNSRKHANNLADILQMFEASMQYLVLLKQMFTKIAP